MLSRIFILMVILVSFSAFSAESDFDIMCGYFEKLDIELNHKNMTRKQKAEFISKLVTTNLKKNSAARQTWEVVLYAVPEERYEMVRSTAIELLKTSWQCKPMKKHISMTGK